MKWRRIQDDLEANKEMGYERFMGLDMEQME